MPRPVSIFATVTCLGLLFTGCATPPEARSTRLADADITDAVLDVRDDLVGSRFLLERDDASPDVRLVVRRVENLSTDRISKAERWAIVSRVIASPELRGLMREKNISVQLPPEQVALLERGGFAFPDLAPEDRATHTLSAMIASATRAGALAGASDADVRKEYYLLGFEIEEVQTREIVWQGDFELAREARGTLVD